MSRCEHFKEIDWRAWIALTWVVCFGLLYGRMVIEQRGGKVRAAVTRLTAGPAFEKVSGTD